MTAGQGEIIHAAVSPRGIKASILQILGALPEVGDCLFQTDMGGMPQRPSLMCVCGGTQFVKVQIHCSLTTGGRNTGHGKEAVFVW